MMLYVFLKKKNNKTIIITKIKLHSLGTITQQTHYEFHNAFRTA
jgi:hypothetical protein